MEAQLASEELQLVNAKNNLDLAYLELVQLLDLKDYEDFQISIPELDIVPDAEYEHSALQVYSVAKNIKPEVKAADARISSAERGLAIARGARSPSLSVRGAMGTGYSEASMRVTEPTGELTQIGITAAGEGVYAPTFHYEITPFADQLEDNLNRSIGFYLTIPIFNNFQVSTSIERSRINLDNARITNQIVKNQLFKAIQQAHADATAALKRHQASEKNVNALGEAFRYTEQRFNIGMVNYIEYNDAKNRLAAAESELLQSKYEYLFRTRILDFYMGNPIRL